MAEKKVEKAEKTEKPIAPKPDEGRIQTGSFTVSAE